MIQPALLGGLFIGVLSALPGISIGNCCCCLWVVCGGLLAAYLVQADRPAPITTGEGALVGLASGAIGAVVWLAAAIAVNALMGPVQERMMEALLERAQNMPPDVREMFETMRREEGVASYIVGFVLFLFAGVVFSTLGGMLGATLFRRDTPPPPAPDQFVPPPPPPL